MGKVIKFLILATFFLCSDALGQSKISNPPTPPPQANHNDDYREDNQRILSFTDKIGVSGYSNIQGMHYSDKDLLNYIDQDYLSVLKNYFKKVIKLNPECVRAELCSNDQYKKLAKLVGPSIKPKYKEQPKYPRYAQENGIQGHVVVAFDVDIAGAPSNFYKVESLCIFPDGKTQENCDVFDKATFNAAKKLEYYPMSIDKEPVKVSDVEHKYSYGLEGYENSALVNYPKRVLNKIEKFTAKKQWILLEDYARDLHGRYELKYYWIAEAQFHKQNYDSAITNYQRVLSFDPVPAKVKGSAKERLLQISYSRNNFSKEKEYCDGGGSYIRNYLCGLNYLTIGDSISGVYSFIKGLQKLDEIEAREDGSLRDSMKSLIESQREYILEDLSKMD